MNAIRYSYRQLIKHRFQSLLNVLGLATGIVSAMTLPVIMNRTSAWPICSKSLQAARANPVKNLRAE